MGPGWIFRSKQESNASLYPLYTVYPLPFILYLFYPICHVPVQSVYTDATASRAVLSIHHGLVWLSHSLFGGLAYKERGCGRSQWPNQKKERDVAHPWL